MENTKENNKLIAEFMGLPTEVFKSGIVNYYFREFNSGSWYEEHELSYNVSWDWLIPVVDKIENTFIDGDKPIITIQQGLCEIELWKYDEPNYFQGNSKLESTYECVVSFIEWYNNKNIER
jgi:hypothetical protein